MAWRVELSEGARKTLSKLDKPVSKRILAFLEERVAALKDPRSIGGALSGSKLGEFWKYRVGDWRLVCSIQDDRLIVYALKIGNRKEVYKDRSSL